MSLPVPNKEDVNSQTQGFNTLVHKPLGQPPKLCMVGSDPEYISRLLKVHVGSCIKPRGCQVGTGLKTRPMQDKGLHGSSDLLTSVILRIH